MPHEHELPDDRDAFDLATHLLGRHRPKAAMEKIRADLIEASKEHEDTDHDGDPCVMNRANAIAWLAHALGMRQPHLRLVSAILEDYEHHHEDHDGGRPG